MKPRKANYLFHRWLGLIVSLQLLAWSVGGFMFSVLEIENVRGERDIAAAAFEPISTETNLFLPAAIRPAIDALAAERPDLATVALMDRGLGPAWETRSTTGELIARLDPTSGRPMERLSSEQAQRVAMRDFAHAAPIEEVNLLESDTPIEYREGVLPAYRVEFDHPKRARLYIDAQTGQITARRNRMWRTFDFFWMLHTMDYSGRDDFNHPLLTAFSLLAIATSGSGIALWSWRAGSCLRRRRSSGSA